MTVGWGTDPVSIVQEASEFLGEQDPRLFWRLAEMPPSSFISIDDGRVSFRVAPSLLLNATDLTALAAFPFSLPADRGGLPSLYWQNLRADGLAVNQSSHRTLLGISKPFFDKRSNPPKAAGVAHADFLMDDFAHTLNAIKRPALTNLAIIKHEVTQMAFKRCRMHAPQMCTVR